MVLRQFHMGTETGVHPKTVQVTFRRARKGQFFQVFVPCILFRSFVLIPHSTPPGGCTPAPFHHFFFFAVRRGERGNRGDHRHAHPDVLRAPCRRGGRGCLHADHLERRAGVKQQPPPSIRRTYTAVFGSDAYSPIVARLYNGGDFKILHQVDFFLQNALVGIVQTDRPGISARPFRSFPAYPCA